MTVANPHQSGSPTLDQIKAISRYKSLPFELAIEKIHKRLKWQKEQKKQAEHEKRKKKMIELHNLKRMAEDKNSDRRFQVRRPKHHSPVPGTSAETTSREYQHRDSRKVSWRSTATAKEMDLYESIRKFEDRAGPGRRPHRPEEYRANRSHTETRRSESDRRGGHYIGEDHIRSRDSHRHARSRSHDNVGSHEARQRRTRSRSPRLDYSRRRIDDRNREPRRPSSTSEHRFDQRNPRSRSATGSQGVMKREHDQSLSPKEESQSRFNERGIRNRSPNRERHDRETDEAADQELDRQRSQQPSTTPADVPPVTPQVVFLCPESVPAWIRTLREQFGRVVSAENPPQQLEPILFPQPPIVHHPRHPLRPLRAPFPYYRSAAYDPYEPYEPYEAHRMRYPYTVFRGPPMGAPRGRGGWYRLGGRGGGNC